MREDRFKDRIDAGRRLAQALFRYKGLRPLVLAIPRGGVVVGREVAAALDGDLNVVMSKKIGAPGDPEFAIGAVMEDGSLYIDQKTVEQWKIPLTYIEEEKKRQLEIIRKRMEGYRKVLPSPVVKGRITILVDDGLATGATAIAALRVLSLKDPESLVLAVPVAPASRIEELIEEGLADDIVCILKPYLFYAISQFYEDFRQVEDREVEEILREFVHD